MAKVRIIKDLLKNLVLVHMPPVLPTAPNGLYTIKYLRNVQKTHKSWWLEKIRGGGRESLD